MSCHFKLTHGSLFSGIGGFDLAAEWMGWENVFHCEWNEFGRKILNHYWPGAISYGDIKKTDFTIHRGAINVLSGGFPCQPYSTAGKRLGKADDRHLWPEMLRAIREIQPGWVVGENVRGITNWNGGVVFDEVQADLEAENYKVLPFLLPAAGINAPHKRERVWFIAHSSDHGHSNQFGKGGQTQGKDKSNGNKWEWDGAQPKGIGNEGFFTNTSHQGLQGCKLNGAFNQGEHQQKPFRSASKFFKSKWDGWPTVSPVRSGDDGISGRLDTETISEAKWCKQSLMAAGNAIVPQVAYEIFKVIQVMEQQQKFDF